VAVGRTSSCDFDPLLAAELVFRFLESEIVKSFDSDPESEPAYTPDFGYITAIEGYSPVPGEQSRSEKGHCATGLVLDAAAKYPEQTNQLVMSERNMQDCFQKLH
jgi:hypothetical protein